MQADMVAVDLALASQKQFMLTDIPAFPPSLQGVPTLIDGLLRANILVSPVLPRGNVLV